MMRKPDNRKISTWVKLPPSTDFPPENIPFGIISGKSEKARVATRIGDTVIDLYVLANEGLLDESGIPPNAFMKGCLNILAAYGKSSRIKLREIIRELFLDGNARVRDDEDLRKRALYDASSVKMMLPFQIGDYTDFYSSLDHASNLGKLFRDPANPLLPNWKYIPVGYHGRTSSIVVSGAEIHRPNGQTRPAEDQPPVFGPTKQLDFELEMAFFTGTSTELGETLTTKEAEDAIFGFVMFNDLSARDIQKWEYVPLGPFLGKNFASVVSPWVVTPEAIEAFRTDGPVQEPAVCSYLKFRGKHHFDINLDVFIRTEEGREYRISRSNYRYLYWNVVQHLAHQTVNGCNINTGDIYASGTISGPDENSLGSMIEMTKGGKEEIILEEGISRKWLEDGDTVIFRGYGEKNGLRIGFGEVSVKILPAKQIINKKRKADDRKPEYAVHDC